MTDQKLDKLPHLLVAGTAQTDRYAPPDRGGDGNKIKLPTRDKKSHGNRLLNQLKQVEEKAQALKQERVAFGVHVGYGIYVEFQSEPGFELKFESLESRRAGIELLAVKKVEDTNLATCYIPEGKLSFFFDRIDQYLTEYTQKGKPKNQPFIESISEIRKAVLTALWTDDDEVMPTGDEVIFWEVWLRVGINRRDYLETFKEHAQRIGLGVNAETIEFPDRTVIIAQGTKSQMSRSVDLLDCIAEVRRAKETADFFTDLTAVEQYKWIDDALSRISWPPSSSPAVCILDTGINREHPMLRHALDQTDMHSYNPNWGTSDRKGHGTEMAGLSLYGDLTEVLSDSYSYELGHRLESVKILPPNGKNLPHLYGHITSEAISRAEITAPERQRVMCLAVSAKDSRDRGKPSSWSARLDALASGYDENDDNLKRLIVVCAGNTNPDFRHLYPDSNHTDGIHDPGQSWNALTVGAFTEKVTIDQNKYPGWLPLAPHGDLSPSSCTSSVWSNAWPIKPDIVLEGGNMALNPVTRDSEYVDSLGLLSTNGSFTIKPLTIMRDTSAATALASRMAAMLQAEHPEYWPETIRALLVHSADWTEAMKARFSPLKKREDYKKLLRWCGFGVPDLTKALWSARNSLTLIAQDSLQPYDRIDGKDKMRDMNLHTIPWPTDVLQELGETEVEMRVTLSYFIEPNPGERGWKKPYRYASHGLRLEVKTPIETLDQFKGRINKIAFEEGRGDRSKSDSDSWELGPKLRNLGSLHSDRWVGTAAELAQRGYLAVYPVVGWWRERHHLKRWSKRARYSLIVTIRTPEADVDIYTPVANLVRQQVEIEI
ncbi:MAG: S8 family peptidase [Deltaproteobacteria bacterium]|nr:S8 family peptidase [Deltaproteobacteria bacterium]